MKTLTYLHNCNSGDLLCALPGIRAAFRKFGKKAIICQVLDFPGHYMPGLVHSVKDAKGVQVTMNQRMFDMLKPLLLAQDYVEDFQVYTNQKIDIDLTIIRESVLCDEDNPEVPPKIIAAKQFVNIPNLALTTWIMHAYPAMACDISEPWIETPGLTVIYKKYILINRTERYINPSIKYSFLKKYQDDILFTGTEKEHQLFCKEFGLDFNRLQVDDFLELAEIMKLCRFFVGNQSFPWNLANAMAVPRILEMCSYAPNCHPFIGKDNYGFYQQLPFEYYFEELYHKKEHLIQVP